MQKIKEVILAFILIIISGLIIFYGSNWRVDKNQREVLDDQENYKEEVSSDEIDNTNIDFNSLIWKSAATNAPWPERDSQASIVFKNKIWIFGGLRGNGEIDDYSSATYFNDIWSSEDGISWVKEKEHAEWSPRRSMSVEYFRGKLWMFGGWSLSHGYKTGIWVSEDGVNWKQVLTQAPWGAREGQVSAVFEDKLWMIGGVRFNKLGNQSLPRDVWNSEDGIHWNLVTDKAKWSGRYDHGLTVFQDKLWLAGGLDNGKAKNDVWSSLDGKTWNLENEDAPWEPRHGMPLLNYKNNLWLLSGWGTISNLGTQDYWRSSDGKNWGKAGQDFSWPGREDQAGLVFKNKIWIFGGMGPYWKWNNDVWYLDYSNKNG